MPKNQNFYGSGTLTANLAGTRDYFDHNANIYTKSPRTDPALYATALTLSPDTIRCESTAYVSTSKIGGCAYYRQPGYLTLRLSDPLTTESARFVFDTITTCPATPAGWATRRSLGPPLRSKRTTTPLEGGRATFCGPPSPSQTPRPT